MKIDANDPKWTAYALGEITDVQEIAEIEKALEESPELRELVEDIRLTAGLLKEELNAEPVIQLTPAQKEQIEAKASAGRTWFGIKPVWISALATAAVLLIVSIVAVRQFHKPFAEPPREQIALLIPNKQAPVPVQDLNRSNESAKLAELKIVAKNKLESKVITPSDALALLNTPPSPPPPAIHVFPEERKDKAVAPDSADSGNYAQSLAGISASNIDIQRDGITVNDIRYKASGISGGIPAEIPKGVNGGVAGGLAYSAAPPPPPPSAMHRPYPPMPPPPPRWPREERWHPVPQPPMNTETYDNIRDNPFLDVAADPLSTFSIDVDTASYSNVRRFLNDGKMPPKDAVRIEELVNYFDYDYKTPKDGKPFAANFEMTEAPWNPEHRLLRIALKGREVSEGRWPNSNLVFLLDVSGSMVDANKLPLVKQAMKMLTDKLTESDRVAIVVYATDTQVWLPSTGGDRKERIREAIDRLGAGGSTNGASGIQLAYQEAKASFIKSGVNRVILCTDGDFNVGITNRGDLTRMIEEKAKSGIYLSALGFGMGNYKDATLETLANKGHGNYAYIDTENEARKVLVEQINSTLVAIAKDVKIQVEFNPKYVSAYRLIGYEDRLLAKEDFNDDTKEAGVIGAGHAVTALYELVPPGAADSKPRVDPLKYQKQPKVAYESNSNEVVTVKVRSKDPEKDTSVLSEFAVKDSVGKFAKASTDFKFAAAVTGFGMALRASPYKGKANLESVLEWAKEGKGEDRYGYRQEFIRLVHRAYSFSD
jgi:Ca-activated chloride channel homolog